MKSLIRPCSQGPVPVDYSAYLLGLKNNSFCRSLLCFVLRLTFRFSRCSGPSVLTGCTLNYCCTAGEEMFAKFTPELSGGKGSLQSTGWLRLSRTSSNSLKMIFWHTGTLPAVCLSFRVHRRACWAHWPITNRPASPPGLVPADESRAEFHTQDAAVCTMWL